MQVLKPEELTIEQKLGQLLIVRGYKDQEDKEFVLEMARKKAVGGIQVLFRDGYREEIRELQEAAGYPILVYSDMERGFPKGQKIPSAMALAAVNDLSIAYEAARVTAIEAKEAGLNAICGPVVDISCPGALCKVNRTFGDDTAKVSAFGCAMIRGYQDEGLLVMAKHYPGGSDMVDDPHIREGLSQLDPQQMEEKDLVPYIDAIKKENLSGIMTGHVVFPKIDPVYPATLSKKHLDIIRKHGFEGLAITDSLAMMGICRKYGERAPIGMAVAAGHDMVLPSYRLSYKEAYEALVESYHQGVFTEEQVDAAVGRIIEAQKKSLKKASADKLTQEQKDRMQALCQKVICPVTQDGISLALDKDTKKLFVLLAENSYPALGENAQEIRTEGFYGLEQALKNKELILSRFPDAEVIIIQEFPNTPQFERVCDLANHCDDVVFFTFNRGGSYVGSEELTKRVEYLIETLMGKLAAIVHIGNPYAVECFQHARRLLLGFAPGECEEYAVRALAGEYTPNYPLPVSFRK